ncbi:PAS domain-containing sensor histidine kinase [Desulfonatronum parangueonense]
MHTALADVTSENLWILDHMPLGAMVLDNEYRVFFWNKCLEYWTGVPEHQIRGQDVREYYPQFSEKRFATRIQSIFQGGPPVIFSSHIHKYIIPAKLPDNSMRLQHVTVTRLPQKNGNFLAMFTLQDVTEANLRLLQRKRAEREIRKINQQLEQVNAEKDRLFAIIAHDLKSPMSGLLTSTKILAEQPELLSPQNQHALLKELHKSVKNTFALLEDLLQWARMSQGGMDFEQKPCRLDELISMSLASPKDEARRKEITIRLDLAQGLTVLIDQPMIKTVFRNIISNAIKFTPRGGEIVITARQDGPSITMAIQDNGISMDEQTLATIFSIQNTKRRLGTEGEKGTGLGMVLCRQFIERHGGRIWLESAPEQGTTVFFTLPTA